MNVYPHGRSWRATFDSGLRHVLLGLVPTASSSGVPPQIVALPPLRDGSPPTVDPTLVADHVRRALADHQAESGVAVAVEAIEYVPNDSPYYEKYYSLARTLAARITEER